MSIALKHCIRSLAIWLLPVFLVWKLLLVPFLAPALIQINSQWVNSYYSNICPSIERNDEGSYQVITCLFQSKRSYSNNSFHSDIKVSGYSMTSIGNVINTTLGLPIFWLLILVMSKQKLKHLLQGTLLLITFQTIQLGVTILFNLSELLINGENLYILTSGSRIVVPVIPEKWMLVILKPCRDVISMMSFLILPGLL